jgi:uncharacterized protein
MDSWTAFALGLVGSLHCAGMCGPLALALPVTGDTVSSFFLGRLAHNLGRLVTYCLLGLGFGLVGKTLLLTGVQRWLSLALGGALLAGFFSSRRLAAWVPVARFVERLKSSMAVWLRRRSFASLTVLGLLNGLLPCGLVYVAGAGATATGGILSGVQYMAFFGAGTVPMMLAIGLSGKLVPVSLRLKLRRAIPVSVLLLGALLILRVFSLGIPYLSPDLSANGGSCCHRPAK